MSMVWPSIIHYLDSFTSEGKIEHWLELRWIVAKDIIFCSDPSELLRNCRYIGNPPWENKRVNKWPWLRAGGEEQESFPSLEPISCTSSDHHSWGRKKTWKPWILHLGPTVFWGMRIHWKSMHIFFKKKKKKLNCMTCSKRFNWKPLNVRALGF